MKCLVRLRRAIVRKSKIRFVVITLIAVCFLYHIQTQLVIVNKIPETLNRWQDSDFLQKIKLHMSGNRGRDEVSRKEILILLWTAYFEEPFFTSIELNADKCSNLEYSLVQPVTKGIFNISCRFSYDRRYLQVSDALVFHSYDLMLEELPKRHFPNQLWVYFQQESPIHTKPNLHDYWNTFNWTMTYRRDSDVYYPYGHIIPLENPEDRINGTSVLKTKTRLIAWIVSNCDVHSKRQNFVKELQQYVAVDIFGECGGKQCPPMHLSNCHRHIQSKYKFYLSFENSLCTDYITEKFFTALKSEMVPVVYGGSQAQDYSTIAPKHSYIDARSFGSPQELASYLLYLDKTDSEYLKYFEWKNDYSVERPEPLGLCYLCQRVFEYLYRTPPPESKCYKDLWKWWNFNSYSMNSWTARATDIFSTVARTGLISQNYFYNARSHVCFSPPNKAVIDGMIEQNSKRRVWDIGKLLKFLPEKMYMKLRGVKNKT